MLRRFCRNLAELENYSKKKFDFKKPVKILTAKQENYNKKIWKNSKLSILKEF